MAFGDECVLSFVFRSCPLLFVFNVVFRIPIITIIEIWLKLSVGFFFIYIVVFDILCIKRLIYKQCDLLFSYMIIAILMIMQSVIIVQIIGNLEHLSLILGTLV